MPILKQLVSTSSQSKRRSRVDLTAEMISAPLGDFRHTMHVGRGGDAFGDTSFLSTRSGEPPKEPEEPQSSPKQSLLSRTFRSSKRSQSVNRQDKSKPPPSQNSVKSAISLPYLNQDTPAFHLPKSVSSSPLKKLPEVDGRLNGAASQSELDERSFGEITDLRPSQPFSGGLRHAESVMSFHIDLGPSMLGDILSVMSKKAWDEDDLGFEEGKGSSPPQSPAEENDRRPTSPQPRSHQHLDSCSVSSSGSTLTDDKPPAQGYGAPRVLDDRDFSYMDEDEDEIRV